MCGLHVFGYSNASMQTRLEIDEHISSKYKYEPNAPTDGCDSDSKKISRAWLRLRASMYSVAEMNNGAKALMCGRVGNKQRTRVIFSVEFVE